MQSKLDHQTQQQLNKLCDTLLHTHNLTVNDIIAEVQLQCGHLAGTRADEIINCIKNALNEQSENRLQEFLEQLDQDETRH